LAALPALAQDGFPGEHWERARTASWSEAGLQAARDYSSHLDTAAVFIVQDGAIVDEWGETARKFNCHSMRKSLLSALYGIHVAQGTIRLDATLAKLGIDDNEPVLTAGEKTATVRGLLMARSGVYHPALYETKWMKDMRPVRGSHAPGTFWYYNNWDFNALGTIFEHETRSKIFEEIDRHIARPIGMEDYQVEDGEYFTGPDSIHPAYPVRMTARDLARFGLLYLREGRWRGRQIVPRQWVRDSTRAYSEAGSSNGRREGYGYMWWVQKDRFYASGAGGHFIVVMPKLDLVVVHRVNTDQPGENVSAADFDRLMDLIVAADHSS
jgi:CubicO group peptidase (beta-lactamase class C family)